MNSKSPSSGPAQRGRWDLSLLTLGATLFAAAGLHAAAVFDPSFGAPDALNGPVEAIVVQPDGKILIGGRFTAVGPAIRRGVARLNPDGSLDHTFQPESGATDNVYCLLLQPDGKVYVGGQFMQFDGARRPLLVRLNPDGSLDETFRFEVPESWIVAFPVYYWSDLGVTHLAARPGGGVVAAGRVKVPGLGSVSPRDAGLLVDLSESGAVTTNVLPSPGAAQETGHFDTDGYGPVTVLADGRVIAALPGNQGVTGLLVDYTRPSALPFSVLFTVEKTRPQDRLGIEAFLPLSAGGYLMAGHFTENSIHSGLVRLNDQLQLDPTFLTAVNEDGLVWSAAETPDGTVWAGGHFESVNGEPRANLVHLSNTGSVLEGLAESPEASRHVQAVALDGRGGLIAGGTFRTVGDTTRLFLARWQVDTETSLPPDTRPPAAPAVVLQPQARNLAAGDELLLSASVSGQPYPQLQWLHNDQPLLGETNRVLRRWPVTVHEAGSYRLTATNATGAAESETVLVTVSVPAPIAGKVSATFAPSVYEAGHGNSYSDVGVDAAGRMVLHDWLLGLQRFLPDGTRDPAFGRREWVTNTIPYYLTSLDLGPDGRIYLSGGTGPATGGYLVRYDEAGIRTDERFPASNPNYGLRGVAVLPDGRLALASSPPQITTAEGLVDVSFQPDPVLSRHVTGVTSLGNGRLLFTGNLMNTIASAMVLRIDGSVDPLFSCAVRGIAQRSRVDSDGTILLVGGFTDAATGEALGYLVRLNPDGSLNRTYRLNGGFNLGDALTEPGGRILVAGDFDELDGHQSPALARLLPDGSVDRTFMSQLTATAEPGSLALLPNGDVAVTGDLEATNVTGRWTVLVLENDLDRRLHSLRQEGGLWKAATLSKAGRIYRLERADRVDAATWQAVETWTGADQVRELTLPAGETGQFYRVREE